MKLSKGPLFITHPMLLLSHSLSFSRALSLSLHYSLTLLLTHSVTHSLSLYISLSPSYPPSPSLFVSQTQSLSLIRPLALSPGKAHARSLSLSFFLSLSLSLPHSLVPSCLQSAHRGVCSGVCCFVINLAPSAYLCVCVWRGVLCVSGSSHTSTHKCKHTSVWCGCSGCSNHCVITTTVHLHSLPILLFYVDEDTSIMFVSQIMVVRRTL